MKKLDWNSFDRGIFLVNVLGIVYDSKTKKILIGRREKDPYVPKLGWGFPGGRPKYGESVEQGLKREIRKKTGLRVKVLDGIWARTPKEHKQFLLLYYYCTPSGGRLKAGEKFKEVKWVKPAEVQKYFATSIDARILKFLKRLKK